MATGSKVFSAAKSWRVPNRGAAVPGANIVLNAAVPFTHNNVLGVTSGDRALMTVEAGRAEATLSETYAKRAKSRAKFERDYRLSLSVQDFKNRWAQYRTTASSPRVHYGTKQEANDCANISVMRAVFTQGRKSYISHGPTAYHRKFSNVAIGNDGMKIEENEGKYGWSHPVRSDPFLREGPRQQPFAVYNLRDATASGKTYEQNGNPANSAKWMHNFERQDAVIHKVARQMNGMGAYYHNTNKSGARQTQLLQYVTGRRRRGRRVWVAKRRCALAMFGIIYSQKGDEGMKCLGSSYKRGVGRLYFQLLFFGPIDGLCLVALFSTMYLG